MMDEVADAKKSRERPTVIVDWETYLADIDALTDILKATGQGISHVYGTPPDGILPGFLISQALGVEFVDGPRAMSAQLTGRGNVLVVFGIVGSGMRVVPYRTESRTAAVYVRRDCKVKPTFYLHDISDEWFVLPYERGAMAIRKRGDGDGAW
jgi:hypothetical protein